MSSTPALARGEPLGAASLARVPQEIVATDIIQTPMETALLYPSSALLLPNGMDPGAVRPETFAPKGLMPMEIDAIRLNPAKTDSFGMPLTCDACVLQAQLTAEIIVLSAQMIRSGFPREGALALMAPSTAVRLASSQTPANAK